MPASFAVRLQAEMTPELQAEMTPELGKEATITLRVTKEMTALEFVVTKSTRVQTEVMSTTTGSIGCCYQTWNCDADDVCEVEKLKSDNLVMTYTATWAQLHQTSQS